MYTAAFVVIAAVLVGAALYVTNQPKKQQTLHAPVAPIASALTPATVPVDGRTLGKADAPHTIDLYEDFQCPVCRDFAIETKPQLVDNYIMPGKAKLVFHNFVVVDSYAGGTTESLDASNAGMCAADQNMFWIYYDWLYANQYAENSGAFTKDRLKSMGQAAGIKDLDEFNSCVDNGDHDSEVKTEKHPSDVNATPTILVDGTVVSSSSYADVAAALDKALGVTPSPSTSLPMCVPTPSGSPDPSQSPGPSPCVMPSTSPSVEPS
jgi:protein-disulfide isomerase